MRGEIDIEVGPPIPPGYRDPEPSAPEALPAAPAAAPAPPPGPTAPTPPERRE